MELKCPRPWEIRCSYAHETSVSRADPSDLYCALSGMGFMQHSVVDLPPSGWRRSHHIRVRSVMVALRHGTVSGNRKWRISCTPNGTLSSVLQPLFTGIVYDVPQDWITLAKY